MSCGCVGYRCGDQQSAGLWLLRQVATELGNHSTITHAESSTKQRKKKQILAWLYLSFMLDADCKLRTYQEKWHVGVGGGDVMIIMKRILLTQDPKSWIIFILSSLAKCVSYRKKALSQLMFFVHLSNNLLKEQKTVQQLYRNTCFQMHLI